MEIKIIETKKTLSETQITLADYAINPYRGCEFGCIYCYSQSNKNIDSQDFFEKIGIKLNSPDNLRRELQYKKPNRVVLGSTTECFQYQEAKHNLTGQILSILNEF